jgi:integrase
MKKLPRGVSEHVDRFGRLRFRARISTPTGRKSLGLFDTPEEAADVYQSALEQLGDAHGAGPTLLSWGETWLDRRELDGYHRNSKKDRSRWRTHVATAPFAAWPLRRIARIDVVKWVRELIRTEATRAKVTGTGAGRTVTTRGLGRKLGRTTVKNALGLLRRALNDAADDGLVQGNVAAGVGVPKIPTTEEGWTYLSAAEIDALLDPSRASPLAADRRAIFTVAIYTGLRAGELWGLRWADVHLSGDRPELVVRHSYNGPTKGGRVRRVPLLRQAREALEVWRRERLAIGATLVFPADHDGCHAEGFEAGWTAARRRAGIVRRVRFHDLRHTCGSHLVMGTWGRAWRLEEIKEFLGHKSIKTTERYAHLAPERLHGARAETDAARSKETKR